MRRFALVLLFSLFLVGPGYASEGPSVAQSFELATNLAAELSSFRPLAEEALALRAETIKVGKRLLAEQRAGVVLSGADLALLKDGLAHPFPVNFRIVAQGHPVQLRPPDGIGWVALVEQPPQFGISLEQGNRQQIIVVEHQSPSFSMVKRWAPLYPVGRKLGFLGAATTDTLAGLERFGVSLFSMVFGNAVGLVETRKGKLSRGDLAGQLRSGLRAGDILLEKTPLRLTDKLIPGYWGRAAVWVGSEQELRDLGIWDDPVVVPYQDQIRSGKQVVEALRSGVEINALEQCMNIDSLGVMRRASDDGEQRAQVVLQAVRQIGKPYDFNFEVESKRGVYCSRLV